MSDPKEKPWPFASLEQIAALREVEARHDCAEECACFRRGLAAVTTIRCSKHYGVPQQNKTECAGPNTGGECGGCIAERAEKAEAENARLMEALVAAGEAYDVALVRAERFRDMHAALVQAESYLSLLRFRGGVRWKQQGSAFGVDVDEVDEAISLSRAALATPAREPKP